LPERNGINAGFLTMAIASGMTSAITNPMHGEVVKACMAADVMMGHDPDCMRWIRKFREAPTMGSDGEMGRGRREGGSRRRRE
jgi:5-methyltetrahydrofolate--homocysteine methyltransferase